VNKLREDLFKVMTDINKNWWEAIKKAKNEGKPLDPAELTYKNSEIMEKINTHLTEFEERHQKKNKKVMGLF